jgi:hypothetical protein
MEDELGHGLQMTKQLSCVLFWLAPKFEFIHKKWCKA